MLKEKYIIKKYFAPLSKNIKGAHQLTDDIAVLNNIKNKLLAINMDSLVAEIHFFSNDNPVILAKKCLRVNISDLIAKGAIPFSYLLSLILPKNINENFIKNFTYGLSLDQHKYGINLIGGDTVNTSGPLTIVITMFGLLQNNKIPRRSFAQIDDDIYITGTIGDGALGLLEHSAYNGYNKLNKTFNKHIKHYLCPEPRVEICKIISQFANASIDISDGLLKDIKKILQCSNVGAIIDMKKIPYSKETKIILANNKNILSNILTGGDDYEVLFTANPIHQEKIKKLSKLLPFKLNIIGKIQKNKKLEFININKKPNISKLNLNIN